MLIYSFECFCCRRIRNILCTITERGEIKSSRVCNYCILLLHTHNVYTQISQIKKQLCKCSFIITSVYLGLYIGTRVLINKRRRECFIYPAYNNDSVGGVLELKSNAFLLHLASTQLFQIFLVVLTAAGTGSIHTTITT